MTAASAQRICTWGGAVAIALLFVGFVISGLFPPPQTPEMSMDEVVAFYRDHSFALRVGMSLSLASGMFVPPMVGVISDQLRRIPGIPPALVYTQISAGTIGAIFFFIGPAFFLATAYRPERMPEITYFMHEFSWFMLVIPWAPACIECLAVGVALLYDRRPQPVFPRWLAYLSLWAALAFVPSALLPFFHSGPFAWSGIFVFWLAGFVFASWFIVITVMLFRAIRQQEKQGAPTGFFVEAPQLLQSGAANRR